MSIEDFVFKQTENTSCVHLTLQGKGGVGKSFVSSLLAQYFQHRGDELRCFDTDPVNKTLTRFQALNAVPVDLMNGSAIDDRKFDNLVEELMAYEGQIVIDNGASTFIPLSSYLIENDVISMLAESGRDVHVHCVIKGGQDLLDTMSGFKVLANQPTVESIVIWLNEYAGQIEYQGKKFEEMSFYQDHADKVAGIIRIPERNPQTFGTDIRLMVERNLTFAEALIDAEFSIMARRRLKMMRDDVFLQIDRIGF